MHKSVLALSLLAAPAAAQCFTVPDNVTTTGSCNVIPFGDATPTSPTWSNQFYQQLVMASDVSNTAGLITALGFIPCGNGVRQFSRLTITMGHCSAATMVSTFASNFTTPPVVVLDVRDFRWNNTMNVWNRLPLERAFSYIPALGNLLIQIHTEGVGLPGGTNGMRTAARARLYAISWSGTPPLTGTVGTSSGLKVEVCVSTAGTATFGLGCMGSNQQVPTLGFSGSAGLGNTLSTDIANVNAVKPFAVLFGTTTAPPYPLPLDVLGMIGCKLYTNSIFTLGGVTNASGAGSVVLPVPNNPALTGTVLFNQAGILDAAANAIGVITTNAGNIVVGA